MGLRSSIKEEDMFKFLKDVVSGSGAGVKDLPYNIGEPYSSAWGSWTHSRGTSKDDGSPVSIFSLTGSNANDGHLAAGRNGVKRLRTPKEAEIFDGSSTKVVIYIVTEPVMPLAEKIKELGLQGIQRNEYYAWGLYRIAKAVSFLNNDCKLVHGNVCLESVVVTPTLDWKLHAFDTLSEFDGNNEVSTGPMLDSRSVLSIIGCLIYEIFAGLKLSKTEELRNTSSIPKDSVEKDTFFRKLPTLAEQLPREIVLKKFLPLLASALEFGSATAPALTAFLKMGAWLSPEEFNKKVLPTIVKLFASNDRAIRVGLLQHIDQYGESFSAQVVDEQVRINMLAVYSAANKLIVYPHIATGFSDTSAFLRELTLKSMLVLAPKLSQRTLSGSLLKYLSKLQVDEEPAIRTNTTILLGNIASHLNEGGVMALCATSSYYDAQEIAARILPNVVVLTIDPDSDVRSKAFQTVEQFLQIVKQYHEKTYAGNGTESTGSGITSLPGNASILGSLTTKSKPSEQTAPLPPKSTSPLVTAVSNASSDTPSRILVRTASSGSDIGDQDMYSQPAPVSPTSTDGWGELENGINEDHESEKDAWDDMLPNRRRKSLHLTCLTSSQLITACNADVIHKPLNANPSPSLDNDDPWAAIAAPPPTTRAKPLSAGRGNVLHVNVNMYFELDTTSIEAREIRHCIQSLGRVRLGEYTKMNHGRGPPPPYHDHRLILISKKLTGSDNYSTWRRSMVIALNAKNKMKIILNTMVDQIGNNLNFINSVNKLWLELQEHYAQIDGHKLFQLTNDIVQLKQIDCTVEVYYHKLKGPWDEFDALEAPYLCTYPLPLVVKAYNMAMQEEKQREGLLPKPATSVKLLTRRSVLSATSERNRGPFRKGIIYGNCNKEGHSREQCYKLVGYPVGHPLHGKFPLKPYKSQSQEYKPNRAVNMVTNQDEGATVQGVQANSSQTVQPSTPSETHMTARMDQLQNQLNQVLLMMQNNNHRNPLHGPEQEDFSWHPL
ncbi:probable inactive serine/threonine-protein kinase scy1 [Tanacetum coccineum]|uniref:Probable inactive serine/threonine-protein kinase scy1 n=1 Tax=Tanacetum coccineum TaxID=301880 RepID=A0ABQ4YHI4_9ASTR